MLSYGDDIIMNFCFKKYQKYQLRWTLDYIVPVYCYTYYQQTLGYSGKSAHDF